MKLIGMLDSPYVRRVAISLQLLGLRFEHQSLSVFRGFDAVPADQPGRQGAHAAVRRRHGADGFDADAASTPRRWPARAR